MKIFKMKKVITLVFLVVLSFVLIACDSTSCTKKEKLESITFDIQGKGVGSKLVSEIKPSAATASYKWFVGDKEVGTTKELTVKGEYFGKDIYVRAIGTMNFTGSVDSAKKKIDIPTLTKATKTENNFTVGTNNYTITANLAAFSIRGFNAKGAISSILTTDYSYIDDETKATLIKTIMNPTDSLVLKTGTTGNTVSLEYDKNNKKLTLMVNDKKVELDNVTITDADTGVIKLLERDVNNYLELKDFSINGYEIETTINTKDLTDENYWVFPVSIVDNILKISFKLFLTGEEEWQNGEATHKVDLFIGKKTLVAPK